MRSMQVYAGLWEFAREEDWHKGTGEEGNNHI